MRLILICVLAAGLLAWAGANLYAAHSDHGCHNCHVPHRASETAWEVEGVDGVCLGNPLEVHRLDILATPHETNPLQVELQGSTQQHRLLPELVVVLTDHLETDA